VHEEWLHGSLISQLVLDGRRVEVGAAEVDLGDIVLSF